MKVLIVGIDSQIGSALAKLLRQDDIKVFGTSRRKVEESHTIYLDLEDTVRAKAFENFDVTFLCASETSIAACRKDPLGTARINVEAPFDIARYLLSKGSFIVYLSSNAVFDGTVPYRSAEARTCPGTPYGEQKAAAENMILGLGKNVAVLRLTKVLTPRLDLFNGWIESLKRGVGITAFKDMVMAPIPLTLVISTLMRIAILRAEGIFQASGAEDISFTKAAYHIAYRLGADAGLVRPTSASLAGILPTETPTHTTLDMKNLVALTGERAPDVFNVLDEVFNLRDEQILAN